MHNNVRPFSILRYGCPVPLSFIPSFLRSNDAPLRSQYPSVCWSIDAILQSCLKLLKICSSWIDIASGWMNGPQSDFVLPAIRPNCPLKWISTRNETAESTIGIVPNLIFNNFINKFNGKWHLLFAGASDDQVHFICQEPSFEGDKTNALAFVHLAPYLRRTVVHWHNLCLIDVAWP